MRKSKRGFQTVWPRGYQREQNNIEKNCETEVRKILWTLHLSRSPLPSLLNPKSHLPQTKALSVNFLPCSANLGQKRKNKKWETLFRHASSWKTRKNKTLKAPAAENHSVHLRKTFTLKNFVMNAS